VQAFAPYGDVLAPPPEVRQIDFAGQLRNARAGAQANLAVSRVEPVTLPYAAPVLERHEHSSQLFVPLAGARMLLLVCLPGFDGSPRLDTIAAFLGDGSAGINYHLGVWHHPMRVVDHTGEFVMLRWDDGSDADTTWHRLQQPLVVAQ